MAFQDSGFCVRSLRNPLEEEKKNKTNQLKKAIDDKDLDGFATEFSRKLDKTIVQEVLSHAVEKDNYKIVEHIISNYALYPSDVTTAIHVAVTNENQSLLYSILLPQDTVDRVLGCALNGAVRTSSTKIIKFLLQYRNLTSDSLKLALEIAKDNGFVDKFEVILSDPRLSQEAIKSCLILALFNPKNEVFVNLLLKSGKLNTDSLFKAIKVAIKQRAYKYLTSLLQTTDLSEEQAGSILVRTVILKDTKALSVCLTHPKVTTDGIRRSLGICEDTDHEIRAILTQDPHYQTSQSTPITSTPKEYEYALKKRLLPAIEAKNTSEVKRMVKMELSWKLRHLAWPLIMTQFRGDDQLEMLSALLAQGMAPNYIEDTIYRIFTRCYSREFTLLNQKLFDLLINHDLITDSVLEKIQDDVKKKMKGSSEGKFIPILLENNAKYMDYVKRQS